MTKQKLPKGVKADAKEVLLKNKDEVPDCSGLKKLENLSLSGSKATSLPPSHLPGSLKYLYLCHSSVTTLEPGWSHLTKLESVDFEGSDIRTLPDDFVELPSLHTLWFSDARFKDFDKLARIPKLEALSFKFCKLSKLPEVGEPWAALEFLDLGSNTLKTLPGWLGESEKLAFLRMSDNRLEGFPDVVFELSELRDLELARNPKIKTLAADIGNLKKLERLVLTKTGLSTLPESIGELSELYMLDLNENPLTELPSTIGGWKNLQYLRLEKTKLKTLPDEIGELSELTELYLDNSPIADLPESICQLKKLETLSLGTTKIVHLPEAIGDLKNLKHLNLRGSNKKAPTEAKRLKAALPNTTIRF